MSLAVQGCSWLELECKGDASRGYLSFAESAHDVPFDIKRIYYIYHVPDPGVQRGGHAHQNLSQLFLSVAGSFQLDLDDGTTRESVVLDRPERGVLLTGLVWRQMTRISPDCVILVLASEKYDPADYVTDYQEFLSKAGQAGEEGMA
tara:strand:- start:560 stop:1000 length:441 start_codon:yes stop_codon:yes gene_type:complete